MENYCRLCAELKDSSEIITSIDDSEKLIQQKLVACCQWNVENTKSKLPQNVCVFCLDKLDECWLFSQNVQLAQRKLQGTFGANDTEMKPATGSELETAPARTLKAVLNCNDCFNPFPTRIALERHHCNALPKNLQCNICRKTFKTITILRAHCRRQSELKCDSCSLVFCKEKALLKHKEEDCKGASDSIDISETKPAFVDCSLLLEPKAELDLDYGYDIVPALNAINIDETAHHKRNEQSDEQQHPAPSTESGTLLVPMKINLNKKPNKPRKSKRYKKKTYSLDELHTNEDGNPNYYCYLCFKIFKKFPLLKGHMLVHTSPRKYKCQFCNLRFRTERHYTSHQKNHIDYFCEICNKKCKSAFALKVHRRVHVGASVKMFGCGECDHFFADVSTYYNHMRRRHGLTSNAAKKIALHVEPNGETKPYVCENCGKDFIDRSSLQAHSVIHFDIRPFKCDVCPKTFKNKYLLKTHQETHSKKRSVQCTECGKIYSCKSALVKHMEEHTGVYKTYSCDFCERIFRNSYNMQNHRRTHTGEKPFHCEVCKYDATTKSQLERHLKTISHVSRLNEPSASEQQHTV